MEHTENNTCAHCAGNGCGHHHMHMMKWFIKIALLVIVFCFAFKMGELKGMLEARGYGDFGYRHGGAMMYGTDFGPGFETGVAPDSTITTPATPVVPTPKK